MEVRPLDIVFAAAAAALEFAHRWHQERLHVRQPVQLLQDDQRSLQSVAGLPSRWKVNLPAGSHQGRQTQRV